MNQNVVMGAVQEKEAVMLETFPHSLIPRICSLSSAFVFLLSTLPVALNPCTIYVSILCTHLV